MKFTTFDDGVRYMDFTEAVAIRHRESRTVSLPKMEFLAPPENSAGPDPSPL